MKWSEFNIKSGQLMVGLVVFLLGLIVFSTLVNYVVIVQEMEQFKKLADVFSLDSEINIPTWFNTILFLLCAVLVAIIARFKQSIKDAFRNYWSALAIIFVVLSVDEAASIHEMFGSYLRQAIDGKGLLFFSWILIGFVAVIIIGLVYLRFILHLPRRIRALVVLSAVVFVSGALIVEMFGGQHAYLYGMNNMQYVLLFTLEESMEMIGLIIFIYAMMSYIKLRDITARVSIT